MAIMTSCWLTSCVKCIQAAEFEQMRCNNKMRFILAVVAGKLKISNRKRSDIEEQLANEGYDRMPSKAAMVRSVVDMFEPPLQEQSLLISKIRARCFVSIPNLLFLWTAHLQDCSCMTASRASCTDAQVAVQHALQSSILLCRDTHRSLHTPET